MDEQSKNNDLPPPSYQEATQLPTTNPQMNQPQPPQQPPTNPNMNQSPHMTNQMYNQQPPTILLQPTYPTTGRNIIIVQEGIKIAPVFQPYLETCQYCHVQGVTRRRYVMGSMACLFLVLSIIFFPFIFFICCVAFQDAHHYCSSCNRLIAIRKR